MYDPRGYTITVRQLDLGLDQNYRAVLRRVKLSGEKHILVHCSSELLPELLKQAQQVGLISDEHSWFITSLDLHTIDLEPFMHGGTNITGLRLIDPDDPKMIQVTAEWLEQEKEKGNELTPLLEPQTISTRIALVYDSVLLFASAFHDLQGSRHVQPVPLNCDDGETLGGGYTFQNIMKTLHVRGLTRDIHFDHKGKRTIFTLDIVELDSSGLHKVAEWNQTHGITSTRQNLLSSLGSHEFSLKNRSFVVLTALVGKNQKELKHL